MTDTLNEFYKLKSCINSCETLEQLHTVWGNLYVRFINNVNKRYDSIRKQKCWWIYKRFKEDKRFFNFAELCSTELQENGNVVKQAIQTRIAEEKAEEDKLKEVYLQMQALSQFYKPPVKVKGFQ